jgi:serine protease inhibitor
MTTGRHSSIMLSTGTIQVDRILYVARRMGMTDCVDSRAEASPAPSASTLDKRIRTLRRLTRAIVLSTFLGGWLGVLAVASLVGLLKLRTPLWPGHLLLGSAFLLSMLEPFLGIVALVTGCRSLRLARGPSESHPAAGMSLSRLTAGSSLALLVPACLAIPLVALALTPERENVPYMSFILPGLVLAGVLSLALGFLAWRLPRSCRPPMRSSWLGMASLCLPAIWAAGLVASVSYAYLTSEEATLPRFSTTEIVPSAQVREVVQGNTALAVDLYQQLRGGEGNLFFSPYSLSAALAMVYAGAKDGTRQQMAQVLHFPLDQERLHRAFAQLQTSLDDLQRTGDVTIGVANSLWVQEGHTLLPEYVALVKQHYNVSITSLDYRRPQQACKKINEWVEQKTNGKIKDILDSSALDALTSLILVNAIYFKGTWQSQFDSQSTTNMPFHVTASKSVDTPMMIGIIKAKYSESRSLQILELAYTGHSTSMLLLLPGRINGLDDVEADLSLESLAEWKSGLREMKVRIILPKFTMTCQYQLDQTLQAMGMTDVFKLSQANLAGMTGKPDLYVSAIIQKAYVEVNEKGTEAAAATATVSTKSRGFRPPREPPIFQADHPFMVLIQERRTGSILFMGRVTDPTKSSR